MNVDRFFNARHKSKCLDKGFAIFTTKNYFNNSIADCKFGSFLCFQLWGARICKKFFKKMVLEGRYRPINICIFCRIYVFLPGITAPRRKNFRCSSTAHWKAHTLSYNFYKGYVMWFQHKSWSKNRFFIKESFFEMQ